MPEKVVSVRLQARVEGFTAGMRKAKKSVDDLTKADVPKATRGYADLANKAALAGGAIAVGLGVAIKRFADFDQAMSAVQANVGGTVQEMEALRAAATRLGADSQFTATEAAQGINELGKAGIKTADILNGGLQGALDLAAAGQIGVQQAAETTATALTQFNLNGDQAVHVADLLAAGANKAQGGVGDLGAALGQAGLVAAGMGLSIEETTAGLTAFASAGLIGSDAGTSFKTMIQRLQAPIGDAKQMLDKYNISAYDAQGNFVGLANVAGQLQNRFKNLTPEVRNNALAVIFGTDAIRGANVLYEQGAEGVRQWTDEVNQSGFAAKQAAALTDNLKGDLERLGGAFDSVLIETGAGANSSLRTLVQGLTGLVDVVAKVPGPVIIAGAGLTALALGLPKGVKAFRDFEAATKSVGISLDNVTTKAPRTGKALTVAAGGAKAFAIAAAAAATAGGILSQFYDDSNIGVEQLVGKLATSSDAVGTLNEELRGLTEDAPTYAKSLDSFGAVLDAALNPDWNLQSMEAGARALKVLTLGMVDLETQSDVAEKRLAGIDSALAAMISGGDVEGAARIMGQLTAAAEAQGISSEELTKKLPQQAEALAGLGNASRRAAGDTKTLITDVKALDKNLAAATGQTDAVSAAVLALGGSAEATSDGVKNLASTIERDMKGAADAFTGDLDVISKYDPEKAAGKLVKATKASEEAEKRLQQVRDRIAAKKKTTVADNQALENATAKAAEARAARVKAADEESGASLSEMYRTNIREAKKFSADIQAVTEAGLDPKVVAKLLEAGPEQAAPILEQMLGKHGARLIQMVNDSEAQLEAINSKIVQQQRLVSIAVNASTDDIAGHLDEATRIVAAKAAAGGDITAEELAKKVRLPLETVLQIAKEYGITLTQEIPPEVGTFINLKGANEAQTKAETFKTTVEEIPETVGTYVSAPGATQAANDTEIFFGHLNDLPDSKDVPLATPGGKQSWFEVNDLKTILGQLHPTNVPVTVTGVNSAIAQIDSLLGKLSALTGARTTHADYKAAQENVRNQVRKATGGAIYGAGTGTSDSIPALLSNGEHVLTAAEVSKLGGQSAVYALRKAVRDGWRPRFADGGAVQYAPRPQVVTVSMGGGSRSQTNDNRLVVEKLVTTAANSRDLRRDLMREQRYQSNRRAS